MAHDSIFPVTARPGHDGSDEGATADLVRAVFSVITGATHEPPGAAGAERGLRDNRSHPLPEVNDTVAAAPPVVAVPAQTADPATRVAAPPSPSVADDLKVADAPAQFLQEVVLVTAQTGPAGGASAALAEGAGMLADLDAATAALLTSADGGACAAGQAAVGRAEGGTFSWVTVAMALAACEIARRQVMRMARASGAEDTPLLPASDWLPGLLSEGVP